MRACGKMSGAGAGGVYWGLGDGCGQTREGAGVNTCTIYRKIVSMEARMEGNYSMTLKMGLGY